MTIIEKVIKKATIKGRTIEFIYVKSDKGKWYEAKKAIYGWYIFKEVKKI